jgi:hypothetical protein
VVFLSKDIGSNFDPNPIKPCVHKKTKTYYYLAQQWGNFPQSVYGIVGVLAKGGKVLDDLAEVGYQVAELAS